MVENESALLRPFVGAGGAGPLTQIVRRYAGLVYSTCLRTKPATAASLSSSLGRGVVGAAKIKVVVVVAAVVVGAGLITYVTFSSGPSQGPPVPRAASRENRQTAGRTTARLDQPGPRQAEPPAPDQPTAQGPDFTAVPSSPLTAAQPAAEAELVTPWWNAPDYKEDSFHLDLSTPEATVRSFTKAIVSGNAQSVMACLLPGGTDYEDMRGILNGDADNPDQRSEYEMRLWLQSLDPDAEMPITSTKQTEHGTEIAWRVTFKKDITLSGQTFRAGDTFELDATLCQSGDAWLIDGI